MLLPSTGDAPSVLVALLVDVEDDGVAELPKGISAFPELEDVVVLGIAVGVDMVCRGWEDRVPFLPPSSPPTPPPPPLGCARTEGGAMVNKTIPAEKTSLDAVEIAMAPYLDQWYLCV